MMGEGPDQKSKHCCRLAAAARRPWMTLSACLQRGRETRGPSHQPHPSSQPQFPHLQRRTGAGYHLCLLTWVGADRLRQGGERAQGNARCLLLFDLEMLTERERWWSSQQTPLGFLINRVGIKVFPSRTFGGLQVGHPAPVHRE